MMGDIITSLSIGLAAIYSAYIVIKQGYYNRLKSEREHLRKLLEKYEKDHFDHQLLASMGFEYPKSIGQAMEIELRLSEKQKEWKTTISILDCEIKKI
jgi:predicted GIY-YIG superfamily endonuclease